MASFGKFRFLTLIKPVLHILPEVAPPDRKGRRAEENTLADVDLEENTLPERTPSHDPYISSPIV